MPKRIIFAVGGTGGHLFPAQALARELQEEREIVFAGHGLLDNRYFNRTLFSYREIPSSTPRKGLRFLWDVGRGIVKSLQLFKELTPDLVIGFGSFHSFPLLVAARLQRVPYVLFESNAVAGRVNQLFAKQAMGIAIQFEEVNASLKKRGVAVDVPIWCKESHITREEARLHYGLDPSRRTLLIFGGSQGADAINRAAKEMHSSFQIIHFTGSSVEELRFFYEKRGVVAHVAAFEPQMQRAYLAADLAICRAGGVTLAELLAFELPALLIPWPGAADNHQEKNARLFAEQIRGGGWLAQRELSPKKLSAWVEEVDLIQMKENLAAYKKLAAKQPLAKWILSKN